MPRPDENATRSPLQARGGELKAQRPDPRLVLALAQVEASLKQVKPWIEERSDYPAALAKLLPLLASNAIARTCPQLFLTIGMCYHMMGKARAARQNYQASLRLDGSIANHVCRRNLMMLHREQGDLEAATSQAKVLIEQDPLNASHQFDLGVIESARGDRLAAVSAYTRAVELNPAYMEAYVNLDASLLQLNDLAKCFQYAQRAIRHCKGFWTNPLQRPSRMLRGLEAKPWHDPRNFRLCEILEANYQVIRQDLDALLRDGDGACVGQRGNHDGSLVSKGSWREHVLLTGQNGCLDPNLAGCWSKCSRTLRILSALPEIVALAASGQGEVLFSALAPGSKLRPHCGPTNARLTAHLGLVIPKSTPDCPSQIRCGDEWREWREGKCIVFDDSFEHEVVHHAKETRVVLLINFFHPQLSERSWKMC